MRSITFAAALLMVAGQLFGEIKTQTIDYADGETKLKGYLAYDDSSPNKRAGVLVIPEWWGLNDYPKSRARQLAELGYVAFVADMYGDGKTTTDAKEAGELAGKTKEYGLAKRAAAALKAFREHEQVDPTRIAAIGYCFGGSTVLEMARAGHDVLGVVSFHGDLTTKTPAQKGPVKPYVLVLHGAKDPFVPPEQVKAFNDEMQKVGGTWEIVQYKDAIHSFTNPNADKAGMPGVGYNEAADRQSWQKMVELFSDLLR